MVMSSEVVAAKFFRFLDENGKLVVSSTLPPDVSQKGYDIVNEMGVVLKTVAPRKTEQQLLEELRNKARLEKEKQLVREQQQLDSILLNSYTDISDIERARDSEITAKERDIMLLKQNIRRLTRLLEDTQTRAARDERLGRPLSKALLNEVRGFKNRIAAEGKEVLNIVEQKSRINERYSSSIIRFSELKAAEQLKKYRPGELLSEDSNTVIYQCSTDEQCETAWQLALRYASDNSTTELAWANEITIMMRKPRKDKDISIIITRIQGRKGNKTSLILEVRCNKTQAGEQLCKSQAVREIEKGFIPYLK